MISRRSLPALLLAVSPLAMLPLARPATALPGRIAVAGGGVAEMLCALGLESRICGADSTAQHPAALRALPQLGYQRALSAEGVLSLRPDILVHAHEAGPPAVLAQLRAAGLRLLGVPRVADAEGLVAAIQMLGQELGADPAPVTTALREDFAALAAMLPREPEPRALFLLSAGNGAPQASGRGTAAAAMFGLAGIRNVLQAYEGYRPLSPEAALGLGVDWLVAPKHSVEARGGRVAFLAQPQVALLPAARAGRLYTDDSLYLLGFGPRTAHAARDLAAALHGVTLPPLPERPWL
ncbi:ABC transporter substrate-binding protein [Sediminicoccus sp. KRV36]|uniref:heme/hemin ABC transporter substrate-binding protein n=1 Tax=Sediminicoccus sp. KRV36 TaxID=3133721 RepID=UPI00200FA37E|nr:ABC transporter substrate-binding protein [Sediminicoccus rosea]UPY38791.1 ABC transporter substrate-binding protein [Sediminicoccus rosea]